MVVNDYGKRAYHIACELEKRIEKIEKNSIESVYNEIIFNFSDAQNLSKYSKVFSINALRESKYVISGTLRANANFEGGVLVKIFVGDVLAFSFNYTNENDYPFSFEATFLKGINTIKAEIEGAQNFSISTLNFKICGSVNYVESNNLLTHVVHDNVDYIGHLINDKLYIYKYDNSNGLKKLKEIENLLEVNFLGVKNNVLFMVAIDSSRNLTYIEYNILYNTVFLELIGVSNVSSVCGYLVETTLVLYYSKLNEIYKGSFTLGNEFVYEKTGRKGVKLYQDFACPENYVIVDKLLNAKLIVN